MRNRTTPPERWYSPSEVADMTGIDLETVYHFLRAGTLSADTIGKVYRVPASAVNELRTALKAGDLETL